MKIRMLAAGLLILLPGCDVSTETIRTVTSDDGVIATVTRTGGDASTVFLYRVTVQDPPRKPQEVLKIDHSGAPTIAWQGKTLVIDASCGMILSYSNYASLRNDREPVVALIKLKNDGFCP